MVSNIELVAGGARGGKSRYALQRAEQSGKNLIFIATAEAGDGSMADRIARHKEERDEGWTLIEEPHDLATIIANADTNECLLIDCLTLWVSNWLCLEDAAQWPVQKNKFLDALKNTPATVIMVTNEVGMGIIPMGELSRQFVDESGWLHQAIAAIADEVVLVMFGIPQKMKTASMEV
ncbi:MAG: bifunctional adenosylcobinamide kinase/adenosylcobinamide-phosphate guanylyltransferase [Gammaproteobacteria bacterium]|nr:bifunctional adenosylcobinamide kinase/adenosylcobinamide-phosphate guanylyltransferase [Gammaproteobacteria bacterium]